MPIWYGAGVQAAPNVTSEITYDLAVGGRIITSGIEKSHPE